MFLNLPVGLSRLSSGPRDTTEADKTHEYMSTSKSDDFMNLLSLGFSESCGLRAEEASSVGVGGSVRLDGAAGG